MCNTFQTKSTCILSSLQAYRLEPLINLLYAQVKPVKMESASSKISQDAVDHAGGPMTDEVMREKHQQQGKSWWSGMKNSIVNYASAKIMGVDSTDGGGGADKTTKTPIPDKVRKMSNKLYTVIMLFYTYVLYIPCIQCDKICESVHD